MTTSPHDDASHGYESVAERFAATRSTIGASTVRAWARTLPPGSSVLDLGCGSGHPISQALVDAGVAVWGIDASPAMVAAFRRRLPAMHVACESVGSSDLFGRTFEGAVAVGLVFLLGPREQRDLFERVASALGPGGRFLFTAPTQTASWADVLTGRVSSSLGREAYLAALDDAGFDLVAEHDDEGGNHYYDAVKRAPQAKP